MQASRLLLASTATLMASGSLCAQFNEPFDSQASANVTINVEPDTNVQFVDYSNMTIGATLHSIPEAPRRLPGSAATRGVLIQANLSTGVAAAVNILAGSTPIPFAGRYRLSFDAWINVPVPLPTGSTEQILWGISSDGIVPNECRHNLATGAQGVYGWLAGENGYSTEDAVIAEGNLRVAQKGDLQAGNAVFWNDAFDQPVTTAAVNNAPANQWTRVDIDVDTTIVRVLFNGIEFFNETLAVPPAGFAMIGYEDAFTSVGSNPDSQWGLFDNFRVITPSGCNFLGTATLQGTASGGQMLNGAAEPAVGAPMTTRLRGGPANGLALLTMGFPSPVTIPIPVGSCTLGIEVLNNLANVLTATDALGNNNFTLEIPTGATLCGVTFGFQYLFLDNSGCGIAHTEGLAMMIGA